MQQLRLKFSAPIESLDRSAWTFRLTSDEYVKCAPEHHGSGQAASPGGKRAFVSVEPPMIFASPHDHTAWGGNAYNLAVVGPRGSLGLAGDSPTRQNQQSEANEADAGIGSRVLLERWRCSISLSQSIPPI